ncbi:uncharacterized mitochondrial protein AtMg00820-like [Helianthus annuus]|uniref:uncharacterized mitochondrial protein AtMg00820-like n=1 Tax=Helianthus annuus TaxID=4232 RepID=UPI000B8F526E|nr:uncharacterized mitochondrial protein AtMg00820-like [Helianthus annuus]
MVEEYAAVIQNATWSLVPLVPNVNVLNCKWHTYLNEINQVQLLITKNASWQKGLNNNRGLTIMKHLAMFVKSATIHMVLSFAVTKQWTLANWMYKMPFCMAN